MRCIRIALALLFTVASSAAQYVQPMDRTGDLVSRYHQQHYQIDGGKMDKFVAWSDAAGLVMSNYDATNMPEGKLAQQYTMADSFFHAAFGGSLPRTQHGRGVDIFPPVLYSAHGDGERGAGRKRWRNTLYFGDNLGVLKGHDGQGSSTSLVGRHTAYRVLK